MSRSYRYGIASVLASLAIVAVATGCGTGEEEDSGSAAATDVDFSGESLYKPGNRFSGWGGSEDHDKYLDEIQPILAKRCVTCHGCTSAACQLKLTSYEGLQRGASTQHFFGTNVLGAKYGPTRIKDATSEAEWRKKGFYSVTDQGKNSVMYKLLAKGAENEGGFDLTDPFALYKDKAELLAFEPLANDPKKISERLAQTGTGMPFGLARLPDNEYTTLTDWIANGAKGPSAEAQKILETARDRDVVADWEKFFNRQSAKERLAMRYIFEHVYFGKIHFDDSQKGRGDFFELVRSSTRDGDIKELVTETSNRDPKAPFFYRLKKHTQIITEKDHTVFHLTAATMDRWNELFFGSSEAQKWNVAALPAYDDGQLNPFVYFDAIPGKIRYQFMLENSHHLIESMVKADVCTGSGATYAIRDRFFTLFLKPDSDPTAIDPKLGESSVGHLDPTASKLTTAHRSRKFTELFEARLKQMRPNGLKVEDIWDGDKTDKNAWISIFRHGTSASAHQGPMGQFPETMWVLDYGNFERMYYDLVVLYRPWAPATHKISTWSTMSEVRSHSEDLFLLFMPEARRSALRDEFTPGVATLTETIMAGKGYPSGVSDLDVKAPTRDFVKRVQDYLGPKVAGTSTIEPSPYPVAKADVPSVVNDRESLEAALYTLTLDRGKVGDALPDTTWLTVEADGKSYDYTILANRIYWSNSRLVGNFLTGLSRRPELDSMSVVRGHIGLLPELFLTIPMGDIRNVVTAARAGVEQRKQLRTKYEVKRNTPEFWAFLDKEHAKQLEERPLESGIIDSREYLWPVSLRGAEKTETTKPAEVKPE